VFLFGDVGQKFDGTSSSTSYMAQREATLKIELLLLKSKITGFFFDRAHQRTLIAEIERRHKIGQD
jgi:hypothetical protein